MHNLQPYTLSMDCKQTSSSIRKKMNWEWIITESWERKIKGYAATTRFGRNEKPRSEIDIQDGLTHLSKNMSTRVPERVTPFVAVELEQLQVTVAFQRPRHVPEHAVHLSYQAASRQPSWYPRGDIHRGRYPLLAFFYRTIRQSYSAWYCKQEPTLLLCKRNR